MSAALPRQTRVEEGVPPASFGTCLARGDWWLIECEPHVMIRLKRWFARVDPGEKEQVRLRRSPEVDRDLQAFVDRFPLEFSERDRAALHNGAEAHRRMEREVALVLAGRAEARAFPMALPPRSYQAVAAELFLKRGSLLLADDLGLGKTVSALAALSAEGSLPALVVAPTTSMMFQ